MLLLVGSCRQAAAPLPPDRIVLVTIDTLRADHLAFNGYPRPVSPFLDRLAEQGLVFEQAYSACSHTAPAHASIFTGLFPAQHRLLENGQPLSPEIRTIATSLGAAGYRTAAFPSVGFLSAVAGSFDWIDPVRDYRPAEQTLHAALEWMRGAGPDDHLFLWIHLFDVHEWNEEERVGGAALADLGPVPDEHLDWLHEERGLELGGSDPAATEAAREVVARYDAQILSVDRALEAFFRNGTEVGLDRAWWFVTSDHGEGLGNHGYMGHGQFLYQEHIRVPLLVWSGDGRVRPGREGSVVHHVDLLPTIEELAGGRGVGRNGHSLLPLLTGGASGHGPSMAFSQRRPVDDLRRRRGWVEGDVYTLLDSRFKVILHDGEALEVYDLERDPLELENLAGAPPEAARRLAERARRLRALVEADGEAVGEGEIDDQYVTELQALGYL